MISRHCIGIASGPCANDVNKIRNTWDRTNIGFIVLKTFMDREDKGSKDDLLFRRLQTDDNNMTMYNIGNTSKEQYNFLDDEGKIIDLFGKLNGVAVIPSIGTKDTDPEVWNKMKLTLSKADAKVIEINLRYLYRGIVQELSKRYKYQLSYCDEYMLLPSGNIFNEYDYDDYQEIYEFRNKIDVIFREAIRVIRDVFPKESFNLIGKLWAGNPDLGLHLKHLSENKFDAVTLLNTKKSLPPKPFEGMFMSKPPQMSGKFLRPDRDYAIFQAKAMELNLPIFASGGVAVEAINAVDDCETEKEKTKHIENARSDIVRCTKILGAEFVQLCTVVYLGGDESLELLCRQQWIDENVTL